MKTEHTPGPWFWKEDHPTNACTEVYDLGEGFPVGIATLYGSHDNVAAPKSGEAWGDQPKRRADARLIAAAPDLLAALEVCLGRMTGGDFGFDMARTAIAKARGLE